MNNDIHIYVCKDGRVRTYYKDENNKNIYKSYPRILMEEKLGRPLKPYEQVHHKDENPQNNEISNLEIVNIGEHQRMHSLKYYDKEMTCEVCGNKFLWTSKRQSCYYRDIKRGKNRIITCSKNCSSYYGRQEQIKRNLNAECVLNGEPSPNGNTVPNINN